MPPPDAATPPPWRRPPRDLESRVADLRAEVERLRAFIAGLDETPRRFGSRASDRCSPPRGDCGHPDG